MFRFTIRDVLWLTVVVAVVSLVAGCGRRTKRAIRTVGHGVDNVTKHAAAIDEAAKGNNQPERD